jgi:UDP-glucose 4-epimerase
MKVLVTGGAGYIGSHTVCELTTAGHDVVIADNLSNSKRKVVDRIVEITGKVIPFAEIDVCDPDHLDDLFVQHNFEAVLHFAGLKAVGESVSDPLKYYSVNLGSTLNLCAVMKKHNVKTLVFSSSATVYGEPEELPLKEGNRVGVGITNPYGRTKYFIEKMLEDLAASDSEWKIIALRYFNPIGAHESGLIGEDPNGTPNNIFPIIQRVAAGLLDKVSVFGTDYDTHDGTGIRDYIHVMDLAKGHVAALRRLLATNDGTYEVFNLGTGSGTSVLELIRAFELASGEKIPYKLAPRRPGDVAVCYASPSRAQRELGWRADKTIIDACRDAWRWQVGART